MASPVMTSPLSINARGHASCSSTFYLGNVNGCSPPAVLGSSPPSRHVPGSWEKQAPHAAAKKWWKRIRYDASLNPTEFAVGFLKSSQQAERKSGVEAWSLRVQKSLVELPYPDFLVMFSEDDVPFHRILFFKQNGELVWESDQYRKSVAESASSLESVSRRSSGISGLMEAVADRSPSITAITPVVEEVKILPSFTDLPEECWLSILERLSVRDLCGTAKTCRYCRSLVFRLALWRKCYQHLFGVAPDTAWDCATVRRVCRHSELRAARWMDAKVRRRQMPSGYTGAACLQLDDSKVLSADGGSLRLWSHTTGRKIATLSGHTGRVCSVAFNEDLIVSADASCMKVWHMDDLKCARTLRGHHEGDVTKVALVGSLPISCCEDGSVRLWDVVQSAPVETLDASDSIYDIDVHMGAGHMASAGWHLDVWDLGTAQRLHRLADLLCADGDLDPHPGHPYSHVAYSGDLLVAGRAGEVTLWDVRSSGVIGTLVFDGPNNRGEPKCKGVQLDEWKLVVAMDDGRNTIRVHDIRAASSMRSNKWKETVMSFDAPAPITCFQFHGANLTAGLEGIECAVWNFSSPNAPVLGPMPSLDEDDTGDALGSSPPSEKGRKKKPAKVTKKETRYPKRKTK